MTKETINKTSRAANTRDKTERPKEYKPPSSLDAPTAPDGFVHRWIRVESMGFQDTKNLHGRLRAGYELVRAEEYEDSDFPIVQDGKYAGVIGVGGLVLARIPEELAQQRQEYERRQTEAHDLLRDQDRRMPMSVERSSKSFGGSKK
jgi:hypothetical protein